MCAALSGALLGTEMGSFTDDDGRAIDCGQFFIALDSATFSGGMFEKQIKKLSKSILAQDGARLPNARREASKEHLTKAGLTLSEELHDIIRGHAKKRPSRRD
jgi:(2R)-3-sulfolactate dehydrogenase (NADP+)